MALIARRVVQWVNAAGRRVLRRPCVMASAVRASPGPCAICTVPLTARLLGVAGQFNAHGQRDVKPF